MSYIYHGFWFLGGSGMIWKNDSQLEIFKLEELTKFEFCVFDLGSEFLWFH